ncbi:hypothetical protein [Haloarcula sp. JP-L23]|uniref:hypothetical protein n=1 Tax=Haloarcula sp. JP-L23 TaxID=2716717 RepID=UPI00140E99DC|nr:hypothetical protein G9465_12325 [Haloarcula sp. JP-L23]
MPTMDPVAGIGAFVAILGTVFLLRFAVAYARSEDLSVSWDRTTQWVTAIAMAVGGAVMMGLVQFGDLVGMAIEFIVSHPYFVSNFAVGGLGAGAISGVFTLTVSQYVGIALAIIGLVFIVVEVDEYV